MSDVAADDCDAVFGDGGRYVGQGEGWRRDGGVQQDGDAVGPEVRRGQVRLTITVEVADGGGSERGALSEIDGGGEGAVAIAEQDCHASARAGVAATSGGEICVPVAIEVR